MFAVLPSGLFACLAGEVLCAGFALWTVYLLLRRARVRMRARALAGDEEASAVVEFPFALIVLVVLTTATCQFAFMASAYLVVDYAAFAATRAAIVPVRGDLSAATEPALDPAKDAAILACYPIAGDYAGAGSWDTSPIDDALSAFDVPFQLDFLNDLGDQLRSLAGELSFVTRYVYARNYTEVKKIASSGSDGLLTVEVTHWFSLAVPYAGPLLSKRKESAGGYQTPIHARASLLMEGQGEKLPPKPEEYEAP